jgi:hypothetical protein
MQHALTAAAIQLPTAGADLDTHLQRLTAAADPMPLHPTVASAAAAVTAHMKAFLGRP